MTSPSKRVQAVSHFRNYEDKSNPEYPAHHYLLGIITMSFGLAPTA